MAEELKPQMQSLIPGPAQLAPPVSAPPAISGAPRATKSWQKPKRDNTPFYLLLDLKATVEKQVKQTALDIGNAPLYVVQEAMINFALENWDQVVARIEAE